MPNAVIFDVGKVLYDWSPRALYERLIPDDEALDAFLRDVVTIEWHFQHDTGRAFAETSAELTARFPQYAELIAALARDLAVRQRSARLKPVAGEQLIELDLRTPNGLRRSHVLHQLNAIGVPWGTLEDGRGSSGTFR